ncbi:MULTISPECIES: DUF6455 family protein [Alphaproteobacteria]|uniref:DUF6455 domain-containing protein n=2 Tax=Alphaproteobacteria TaxID=28211 RepID=A0A512HPU2_9HYPH|nr:MULTISPECIES: DUF6455 family protein [Alphaproteobacteria]GEO87461.1 hypothetical protein RNA01_43930 [Ciceribacter naphthalenivorans]GLR23419.1 hypothetical protein GCM10007920_32100 [Ciceribacter naphthalenivorans]GLT06275.1 hypothetical protein GCM10007926_32100 [Sphingomonas psychrolutea]
MHTVAHDSTRTVLLRVLDWFSKGWESSAEADMIAALDEGTIRSIAHDCGISPDQLIELAKAGPHAADEMIQMMKTLNIDPVEVELRLRNQFRDMQITCAHCASKGECRKDLGTGAAGEAFVHYCGNAEELNALRANPDFQLG